ncbi:MAG TPA: glycosyltransferase, partial [Nitrosopumilaceae archaeon]|nr:glycosyltransferase [Nitrosopumilaceae archaeon]
MRAANAPIVLFTYNRPLHTRQTLRHLMLNDLAKDSHLYIYIDGPKTNASQETIRQISEVKTVVREEQWCKEVTIIESDKNLGLAASVIKGVSEVLNKYGKVIVLEDDLVCDTYFLKFMNDGLQMYENNEEVISVTGYVYPVKSRLPDTYFLKGADCWGWATWKRGWDLLQKDGEKLLNEIVKRKLEYDFDFYGSYPYVNMLKDQIAGKNSSWAILWYASAYLQNKLTLYPGNSLVQNIGNDGSGTHNGVSDKWIVELTGKSIDLKKQQLTEDKEAKQIIADYFKEIMGTKDLSLLNKLKAK